MIFCNFVNIYRGTNYKNYPVKSLDAGQIKEELTKWLILSNLFQFSLAMGILTLGKHFKCLKGLKSDHILLSIWSSWACWESAQYYRSQHQGDEDQVLQ